METEVDHYSWEEIYHLYGISIEVPDALLPSRGAKGRSPTPLTHFLGSR